MNKVQLIGRLTKDPELKYTKTNIPVARYTIALNDGYGEKQTTEYINIVSWGNSGEFVSQYFKKGQAIAIVGRLKNNNYEDKNGNKRYTTEVVTESIEFVGDKKKEEDEEKAIPDKLYMDDIEFSDDELPF